MSASASGPSTRARRRGGARYVRPRAAARRLGRVLWAASPAAPPAAGDAPRRSSARWALITFGLYAIVALVMTYPLAFKFTTSIPGDAFDAYLNLWSYWWVSHALIALQNPFWTPLLYAPFGAPLYLHTLNPINGVMSLPVQVLAGPVVTYNVVILLSLTLSAFTANLLVAYVCGSRLAGWFGGLIFAFGSYHVTHLLGHANLLASEGLPLYLLLLLLANASAGKQRTLAALGAVLALLFTMLSDWQYVVFAIVATLLFTAYQTIARRSLVPVAIAGAIGAIWFVLALPLIIPTWRELESGIAAAPGAGASFAWSADLVSFFVPSPLQSLWGGLAEQIGGRVGPPANERSIFLGYLPLALAACGLWFNRKGGAYWALLALVAGLLALGPALQVLGESDFGPAGDRIPLPYALLDAVPGLNILRVPARFALLVTLSLAVLSGLGIVELGKRLRNLWSPPARVAAIAVLSSALLLEHVAIPFPMTTPHVPRFYTELARSPERGVIYELPFSLKRPASLYSQTVHQRSIVGGYVSRRLNYPLRLFPPFAGPTGGDITPPIVDAEAVGAWVLHATDVRWLVVLRQDPQLNQAQVADFLARFAEPEPLFVDKDTAVYRPRPPGPPLNAMRVGDGWFAAERVGPDQTPMRWFSTAGTLHVWALDDKPQVLRLRFDAATFYTPRRLRVSVDRSVLGEWLVADIQRFDIPFTLTPGLHTITLEAVEPPVTPSSVKYGIDGRLLSFAIMNVRLER